MRRMIAGFTLSILVLAMISSSAWAQEGDHFVLEGLHLIAWEDVPDGRPSHVGPVSSAILMAWHAAHGHPRLLPDMTHDGRIDEGDTVMLAQAFAEAMASDDDDGVYVRRSWTFSPRMWGRGFRTS